MPGGDAGEGPHPDPCCCSTHAALLPLGRRRCRQAAPWSVSCHSSTGDWWIQAGALQGERRFNQPQKHPPGVGWCRSEERLVSPKAGLPSPAAVAGSWSQFLHSLSWNLCCSCGGRWALGTAWERQSWTWPGALRPWGCPLAEQPRGDVLPRGVEVWAFGQPCHLQRRPKHARHWPKHQRSCVLVLLGPRMVPPPRSCG